MRNLVSLIFSVLFLVIFAGCGARYIVGGETFGSSSEALQKQTEIRANLLNKITHTDNPVHGTALVLIPSDIEIHKNHLGMAANFSRLGKEQIDYIILTYKNYFQLMAEAIRKRGNFDSVSVERHNGNPASFPIGDYDFMVFADVDGWAIRSKATLRPLPIAVDEGKPFLITVGKSNSAGDAHMLFFLNSLSQQATALISK